MSDKPYPDGGDTMHYELHTAWDEGYAEGFAAGRAALPDPPEAFLCPDCGHIGDAVSRIDRACVNHPPGERRPMVRLRSRADAERLAAALPDERLREALEGLLDAAAPYLERAHPDEKLWDPPDYHNYQRLAGAIATARALAVTDRDTEGVWPDQSAMHGVLLEQIKDAYAEGIADTLDRIRVRAAEMLPEVARFTLDEIEALAAADRDKEEDER